MRDGSFASRSEVSGSAIGKDMYSGFAMSGTSSDVKEHPAPKPSSASVTEMTEYVLPQHANALGGVFGGQIMGWVDLCAAICAQRHSGRMAVTAYVDDLKFEQPVRVGEVVRLEARITATFRTSMEIEVVVQGEQAMTGRRWPCVTAR